VTGVPPQNGRDSDNRRRHRRVDVAGIATVGLGTDPLTVWVLQNLSMGGASLVGDSLLIPGQRVTLTLHLPTKKPLPLEARVLRRQLAARRGHTAIAFTALGDAQKNALSDAVEQPFSRANASVKAAIVVGPSGQSPSNLMHALTGLGYDPRFVTSPLDGAAWLQKEALAAAIMVDEKMIEHRGFRLLELVRDTRPEVRRLVVASSANSFRTDVTLRTGEADAVIERPFHAEVLRARLGLMAEVVRTRKRTRRAA
jgi:CheY-like chemotaxis protein